MLKVKTKFRLIIAFYMMLPITVIFFSTLDATLFSDHYFQTALTLCLAITIGLALCSPLLPGFKWIFFKQIQQISNICSNIKNGNYLYFQLPNEPNETGDENELIFLMRNMNWMIHQITVIADRITKAAESAFIIQNQEVHVSASIGIVEQTLVYENANHLLRDADLAMYHAKDSGKAQFKFFTPRMHEDLMASVTLEKELRKALEIDELALFLKIVKSILSLSKSLGLSTAAEV